MSDKIFSESGKAPSRDGGAMLTLSPDTLVPDACAMADAILRKADRGPGDTIDAAMHRAARDFGAPRALLHRLRYRRAELRDIPGTALLALVSAYRRACLTADAAYLKERDRHDPDSALVRLADLVAGEGRR